MRLRECSGAVGAVGVVGVCVCARRRGQRGPRGTEGGARRGTLCREWWDFAAAWCSMGAVVVFVHGARGGGAGYGCGGCGAKGTLCEGRGVVLLRLVMLVFHSQPHTRSLVLLLASPLHCVPPLLFLPPISFSIHQLARATTTMPMAAMRKKKKKKKQQQQQQQRTAL